MSPKDWRRRILQAVRSRADGDAAPLDALAAELAAMDDLLAAPPEPTATDDPDTADDEG